LTGELTTTLGTPFSKNEHPPTPTPSTVKHTTQNNPSKTPTAALALCAALLRIHIANQLSNRKDIKNSTKNTQIKMYTKI
jgi:hypothetical protein